MAKFLNRLEVVVPISGKNRILLHPLNYRSSIVVGIITAPVGMLTDYGSIPKILHSFLSPTGPATYAFVIHDSLYQSGLYTRKVCDAILEEAMIILSVGYFTRKSIITGVRVGGWVAWNNHREKDIK